TERLESMRQDFIANVSHELRTPLTVFRGYLELLNDYEQLDRKHLLEIIHHMDAQSHRMERLVEDLLLLAQLESMEPNKERHQKVNFAALLKDIIRDAKTLSNGRHYFSAELNNDLSIWGSAEE